LISEEEKNQPVTVFLAAINFSSTNFSPVIKASLVLAAISLAFSIQSDYSYFFRKKKLAKVLP
jgi:hypothetical protein